MTQISHPTHKAPRQTHNDQRRVAPFSGEAESGALPAKNPYQIYRKYFDHRTSDPYNEYEYDDLDRLALATYIDDANEVFTMDDLGNRQSVNLRSAGTQTYTVDDDNNQYTAIDSSSLTYDDAGNLTADHHGYQYTYDYENRIVKIEDVNDVDIAEFTYDALGRRIEVYDARADESTYYIYNDQWQVLAEYDGSNNLQRYFIYGNYIDEPLIMNDTSNDYYYAHDHLYSAVALTDSAGDVAERYEYDAYGNVHIMDRNYNNRSSALYDNPYTFTGRRLDSLDNGKLKLMYYRHRSYHPKLGRFLQKDPIGFVPTPRFFPLKYPLFKPLDLLKQYVDGLNSFGYCTNNPIGRLDPTGLNWFEDFSEWLKEVFGIVGDPPVKAGKCVAGGVECWNEEAKRRARMNELCKELTDGKELDPRTCYETGDDGKLHLKPECRKYLKPWIRDPIDPNDKIIDDPNDLIFDPNEIPKSLSVLAVYQVMNPLIYIR